MQGFLLILNPNQNPMQRARWETRTPIAPMARSTLAVIAALELTPLPQTIRGNYLLIIRSVCDPMKPMINATVNPARMAMNR